MDKYYWALVASVPGIGSGTVAKLKKYFPSGEAVVKASYQELKASKAISRTQVLEEFIALRKSFNVESLAEKLERNKVSLISIEDDIYPELLKEIYNAPPILYCRGDFPKGEKRIAMVGSRNCTPYGKQVAEEFARDLAKAGFVVVSGAASGIDAASHWGALKTGETIGVLGCGLDKVYPTRNLKLYREIVQHGAIVTEYPFGMEPLAKNFPARNRVIAGMCQGILVVEGAKKSGSLITAEFALSEGRDVFAVPGNIYSPNTEGTHRLIQEGAKLVTCVEDIIQEYESLNRKGIINAEQEEKINLTDDEFVIYQALDYTIAISVDELIYKLRDKVSNIAFILLQMKLKGVIQETSPNFYIKSNRGALHE